MATSAKAASFECAKAATAMEKAICGDPKLSKADEDMAASYAAARKILSPAGQLALRDSQRSFLKYAQDLCRPGSKPLEDKWGYPNKNTDADKVADCLMITFMERDTVLAHAATRIGGRVFLNCTTYRVWYYKSQDADDQSGAVEQAIGILQIDVPKTPAEQAWNAMARKIVMDGVANADSSRADGQPLGDGDTSSDVALTIAAASPDLIVATLSESTYTLGMAHPFSYEATTNWSLSLQRPITANDLFEKNQP